MSIWEFPHKYSFDIVSMLLMILLFVMLSGKRKANIFKYKTFYWIVAVTFFASLLDFVLWYICSNPDIFSWKEMIFYRSAMGILVATMSLLFTVYVLAMSSIDFRKDKLWHNLIVIPYIIFIVVMIANTKLGILYSIDENGNFVKGDLFAFLLTFSTYYVILWLFIAIKYSKVISKTEKGYIVLYSVIHMIVLVIYAITGFAGAYAFELAIELIVSVYTIQSPNEYFDKSDAILYEHLLEYSELDLTRKRPFTLVYVRFHDVDMIYDVFGEGNTNRLLSQAVNYFANVDKDVNVFRVDRNTFVLKMDRHDEMRLHAIKTEILTRFKSEFKFGDISARFIIGLVTIDAPDDLDSSLSDRDKIIEITKLIDHSVVPIDSDISYKQLLENDKESEIIEAVKRAVDNKGFQVFYQPIYSTHKKKIIAAEALIRLFDSKLGFVSPEIFIPLAEREGYILEIGEFVFTEVCKFYSENKLNEKGIDYIEVNLSAVQCMQYRLADEFVEIMHKYGLNSSQINFEITETSAMNSNRAVELNINYFVDHGVDLSLDDFGTGYSNISYLYHLPFAFMKIDKSILWSSDKNDKANITLKNVFKMAKNLKMRVVVEGVETEEHIKKLLKLECDYFQGYYFSKPVNGGEFIKYLDNFSVPKVCLE